MRDVLLRLEGLLFLTDPGIRVESVQDDGEVIRVGVRCRTAGARCPGRAASRRHLDRAERGCDRLDIHIVDSVEHQRIPERCTVCVISTITGHNRLQQRVAGI
ncbi:hypothetical protein [Streptomyces niveus]|uniref:hypothetical protein n=1 Tax=Streptomyces niveus TaxID=193462 RepID=UPI0003C5E82F|nr:hypothetical protein [Streptomyces niveus]EST18187.1 hypothetical protein M877_39200 [Streptomyces niveus NCIMB 11891]